jgi:hypothetical protein
MSCKITGLKFSSKKGHEEDEEYTKLFWCHIGEYHLIRYSRRVIGRSITDGEPL